jgi:hypothetical protein
MSAFDEFHFNFSFRLSFIAGKLDFHEFIPGECYALLIVLRLHRILSRHHPEGSAGAG